MNKSLFSFPKKKDESESLFDLSDKSDSQITSQSKLGHVSYQNSVITVIRRSKTSKFKPPVVQSQSNDQPYPSGSNGCTNNNFGHKPVSKEVGQKKETVEGEGVAGHSKETDKGEREYYFCNTYLYIVP